MIISVLAVVFGLTGRSRRCRRSRSGHTCRCPPGRRSTRAKFRGEYFRHLSSPDVLSKFKQDYAGYIDYYGKVVNQATVMQEKASFVHRWPQREYRPRRDSIVVSCMN